MRFPRAMPCAHCGESVPAGATATHTCDPRRRLEFDLAALGPGVASFDDDLRRYLAGSRGRFETWLAHRDVRRDA